MDTDKLLSLVGRMTLEEKLGQMTQVYPGNLSEGLNTSLSGPAEYGGSIPAGLAGVVGSVLGSVGAEAMRELQDRYMSQSRLGIPLLFMTDVIHGYRTIYPSPLGMACTWDTDLAEASAAAAAKEAAVSGVQVTFSPMADLARDPRWGRCIEGTGEDPYLGSLFAAAFVRGYQGRDSKQQHRLASCVKHFAAYGAAEGGRDYNTTEVSGYALDEFYLPAYKAAIDAGCRLVMASFNCLNGVPATGNIHLLREILRERWGFDGVLISDCTAVPELVPHGFAETHAEAAMRAVKAGVDIEMVSTCYWDHIPGLIGSGDLDETLLDEAVLRVLQLKDELGLFDAPYKDASAAGEQMFHLCEEHRALARRAAAESLVLLKNDGLLPLPCSGVTKLKVAVIGPHATERMHIDIWSGEGRTEDGVSLADAISGYAKVRTSAGCGITDGDDDAMESALLAAKAADVVVLAVGEHPEMSGEAGCRAYLELPGRQQELVSRISELGIPTAAVVFSGRPLALTQLEKCTDAVLQAWFPGTEGGMAIAETIFGIRQPGGRLTMSFPYTVGQLPLYYNTLPTGRPLPDEADEERYRSRYCDAPSGPLHPFGYGLTYTSFSYGKPSITGEILRPGGSVTISVEITNTGAREGTETAQLYIRDMGGSYSRPVRELKGFRKIRLAPGESAEVSFTVTEEMLRYHTAKGYRSEPGGFRVCIAPDAGSGDWIGFTLIYEME
jgi:beta-glucosidase